MGFHLTGDPAADEVLDNDPFALLLGMMLDQQVTMELAFAGPKKVLDRFGSLDPAAIADADPESFAELCAEPPAVHRVPASMAARMQELARIVAEEYGGDAGRLWREAPTGKDLFRRVSALPGFGRQKSQIFVALLAKQLHVRPDGWQQAAGEYGEEGYRSVADIVDADSLQQVRAFKQQRKAAAKAKKAASAGA